jgi:hypothetical protein
VAAERKRLAEETAAAGRGAEEARAHLLELKARVVEAEAGAAAALQQVRGSGQGGREAGSCTMLELTAGLCQVLLLSPARGPACAAGTPA